jgi:hypothetical protein
MVYGANNLKKPPRPNKRAVEPIAAVVVIVNSNNLMKVVVINHTI